jgi:DnaJ domain/PilZ domain
MEQSISTPGLQTLRDFDPTINAHMGFSIMDFIGQRRPQQPRRHPRYETPNVRCTLGEAIDLSLGGMRVRSSTKPSLKKGDALPMWIEAGRKRLHIIGQVAWTTRRNKMWYLGVTFLDTDKRHHHALEQLARYGCFQGHQHATAPKNAQPSASAGSNSNTSESGVKIAAGVDVENLYAILGVCTNATREEITAAYRKLARQYHPDAADQGDAARTAGNASGQAGTIDQFTRLNKAYIVLRDPTLRDRYNELISGSTPAA